MHIKVLGQFYKMGMEVHLSFREHSGTKWPRISTNDPTALREFADFLKRCAEAILHVKGLSILNDCENHKLLKKLPEWIVH